MSNICYCGSESGYPHDPNCPFPYYGEDSEMVLRWQRDRNAKIAASLPDAADRDACRAENAKLREALRPLAEIPCLEDFDDDYAYDCIVKAGDVRRARAALA